MSSFAHFLLYILLLLNLHFFYFNVNFFHFLPNSGSLAGGTVLKISGEGFSRNQKENMVDLCGVKCDVLSSNATTIMCLTRSTLNTVKEKTISSVSATTNGK